MLQIDYILNMDKATEKKLGACNADYMVSTEFKGGNYIFTFSAAMYELYRDALVQHFECLQEDTDRKFKATCKDCTDSTGPVVESLLKIHVKNSNRLKYSINLYHT